MDVNNIIPPLIILGFIVFIVYITNKYTGWFTTVSHGLIGWLKKGAR